MEDLLVELTKMVSEGKLKIEGATIGNSGYEIELGANKEGFDGGITLRVTSSCDVIELGDRLGKAMQK